MKTDAILQKLNGIEANLQQEKPLSFKEACQYLDVSKSYLYKLTCKSLIAHFKPNGKKIYFKKSDLDRWIYRNRKSSDAELEQKATDFVQLGTAL